VIVAGATTSGCVRATVVDTMGSGFLVVVAADCVDDRAEAPHQASLFDMAQKYADLMSTQSIQKSFLCFETSKAAGAND
jgi:maleamate amidohydrolase